MITTTPRGPVRVRATGGFCMQGEPVEPDAVLVIKADLAVDLVARGLAAYEPEVEANPNPAPAVPVAGDTKKGR